MIFGFIQGACLLKTTHIRALFGWFKGNAEIFSKASNKKPFILKFFNITKDISNVG